MFTRRGDTGETDLASRVRVGKDSPIVEVQGVIDELNAFIGQALVLTKWEDIRKDLFKIQNDLFVLGEDVSTGGKGRVVTREMIDYLEDRVNVLRKEIGKIELFVIPGGTLEATSVHIARTVSRRLERRIVFANHYTDINKNVLIYANRLSSLLFMIAMVSNKRQNVEEKIWPIHLPKDGS
ncbi:cob(I)yrinic acid a,c-diamide adenosyltransferase [Thermoplasma volcanium]|nr:cob(I)yrinic acid a,c-diamide adenosyltransferase [Thermoplasma volcanium]